MSSVCAQSDLQETFLKYPGSYILDYTIISGPKNTEENCVEWCRNVPECRTVEFTSSLHDCYLHSKTALDVPWFDWMPGYGDSTHYQKMCA